MILTWIRARLLIYFYFFFIILHAHITLSATYSLNLYHGSMTLRTPAEVYLGSTDFRSR